MKLPFQNPDPSLPLPTRKRSITRWLIRGLAVLACLAIIVWNLFLPAVPRTPLKMTRGSDGKFIVEGDEPKAAATFQAQAGTIAANNALTAGSTESSSDRSRLACRRILLENTSDELLAQRIAGHLLEAIKKLPDVGEIEFLPPGKHPEPGRLAPDVFITLSLPKLTESGLIGHVVDAEVVVSMSSEPESDNYSLHDHLSPPTVEFHWMGRLKHHSTSHEVASSAAKYQLVAANIGQQFGDAIAKQLDTLRDKFGRLPLLPEAFYPAYHEPPVLPLAPLESRVTYSDHGLLLHNQTIWQCTTDKPLPETLAELRTRLEADGWKNNDAFDDKQLVMQGPAGRLNAFAKAADGLTLGEQKPIGPTTTFFVRFAEPASTLERGQAVESLFETDAPLATLLLFENDWAAPQRTRILAQFADYPPTTPEGWLTLASLEHQQKRDHQSSAALLRAVALYRITPNASAIKGKLCSLAKDLGDEKLIDRLDAQPPDFELLKQLGVAEISPDAPTAQAEFDAGEAANFLLSSDKDDWRVISFAVKTAGVKDHRLIVSEVMPHGSSVSSTDQSLHEREEIHRQTHVAGIGVVNFTVTKLPAQARFRVTAELLPDQALGVAGPGPKSADAPADL